jgi:GR25 family glycosyltransferase involved in LPS biosynthesis
MKIHFLVLNMKKNNDRWLIIETALNNLLVSYERIDAIDGFKLENNKEVLSILEPRDELKNTTFYCKIFNQEWIYNGLINNSFPGLNLNGHQGAKGLILSNIKALKLCSEINNNYIKAINDDFQNLQLLNNNINKFEWFCILEDDAIINEEIYRNIIKFLNENKNENIDIILLDQRIGCGSAGILYNSRIINQLINDLHPLSEFSITMEEKYNYATLWDWKIWQYILNNNINYKIFPCIDSGLFGSTITI